MPELPDPTKPLDPEVFRLLSEEWKAWATAYKEVLSTTTGGTTAGQWGALECAQDVAHKLCGLSGWLEKDLEVRRGK